MNRSQKTVLAALLTVHFAALALVLSRSLDFLFNDAAHRIGPGTDFWAFYNAGKHWVLGNSIFDRGPGFGFRYHPILAQTVMAALSQLKHDAAYWVWVVVHEIFFLSALGFVRKLVADTRHFLVIAVLMVCFTPYYLEVYMGNASFLVAALLMAAFYFYQRDFRRRFFFFYLGSILVKPIGLVLLPVLLFRRHYRIVLLTVIILIGLAVPYFVLFPADWQNFVGVNFEGSPADAGFMVHGGNQGFYALLLRISAAANDIPLSQLASLSQLPGWNEVLMRLIPYLFVLLALIITYRQRHDRSVSLLLFIWSATYLLAYKDVWEHSYSFLFFGLLYLYLSRLLSPGVLMVFAAGLALPTAFALYDITFEGRAFHDPDWHWSVTTSLVHHATKPIWLISLYALVIARVFRSRRAPVRPQPGATRKAV